ncbi:MAG: tRNA dihydrouridine synthase DusB [Lentimicrobium sp.]|nr:tRNA dihydrouridine synthase DusB [Lentimicrobium sp.]
MKIGDVELGYCPLFLAPMEDITDPPFRRICRQLGADAVVTEFISSEGLIRDIAGSLKKMNFSEDERPVGIQIFGNNVEAMVNAAKVAEQAGPDFIDLNFGCPVRKIVNKGGGAALLQDLPLMLKISESVVNAVSLPVTAKTRLGWDESSKPIVQLALWLQDAGIQALTIHGRTRAQMYSGQANWSLIGEVKRQSGIQIPIIGNGDIVDGPSARAMLEQTYVDGIMLGRAAIGNPWIFNNIRKYLDGRTEPSDPGIEEKLKICRLHLSESVLWKGERTAVLEMRKHYSRYFKALPDFKPFRMKLMLASGQHEIEEILDQIRKTYTGNHEGH